MGSVYAYREYKEETYILNRLEWWYRFKAQYVELHAFTIVRKIVQLFWLKLETKQKQN